MIRLFQLCVLAISLANVAVAAEPPAGEEKVKAALERPYKSEFLELPLQDMCAFLSASYGVDVRLGGGSPPLAKITYVGKGDKLRVGLATLLKPHKLGFSVIDGKIVIAPLPP